MSKFNQTISKSMPDECNPFKPLKCNSTSYEKKRKKKKKRFSDACNLSENYNITLMAMRGIIRRGISHDSVVLNGLTD